jgi:hypothetical protein
MNDLDCILGDCAVGKVVGFVQPPYTLDGEQVDSSISELECQFGAAVGHTYSGLMDSTEYPPGCSGKYDPTDGNTSFIFNSNAQGTCWANGYNCVKKNAAQTLCYGGDSAALTNIESKYRALC